MAGQKGILIDCSAMNHQVHLIITSDDRRGILKILSDSGSRLSSTVSEGSTLSYSINQNECPLAIVYDTDAGHMEFTVGADGNLN